MRLTSQFPIKTPPGIHYLPTHHLLSKHFLCQFLKQVLTLAMTRGECYCERGAIWNAPNFVKSEEQSDEAI
jgi:hypothetical protein